MNKVLICGSRDATPPMIEVAAQLVLATFIEDERYPSLYRASIIVGDAYGIDAAVVKWCDEQMVDYHCYGVTPRPRCNVPDRTRYTDVWQKPYEYYAYPVRDRHMVDLATHVIAVWDGQSKGTKYTYDYAVAQGKKAKLITP